MKIFFKGGCDLVATRNYLLNKNIDSESIVKSKINGNLFYSSHSSILLMILKDKKSIFLDESLFKSKLKTNNYDIIVFSTISECFVGTYQSKISQEIIPFGDCLIDATVNPEYYLSNASFVKNKLISNDIINELKENFIFLGRQNPDIVVKNYHEIISLIPNNTKICILLGPTVHGELYEENPNCMGADDYYKLLNDKMIEEFKGDSRVSLINPTEYITKYKKGEYFFYHFQSLLHYRRKVYRDIAKRICKIYKTGFLFFYARDFFRKIYKIFRRRKELNYENNAD